MKKNIDSLNGETLLDRYRGVLEIILLLIVCRCVYIVNVCPERLAFLGKGVAWGEDLYIDINKSIALVFMLFVFWLVSLTVRVDALGKSVNKLLINNNGLLVTNQFRVRWEYVFHLWPIYLGMMCIPCLMPINHWAISVLGKILFIWFLFYGFYSLRRAGNVHEAQRSAVDGLSYELSRGVNLATAVASVNAEIGAEYFDVKEIKVNL